MKGEESAPSLRFKKELNFFEASRVGFVTVTEENRNQSFFEGSEAGLAYE